MIQPSLYQGGNINQSLIDDLRSGEEIIRAASFSLGIYWKGFVVGVTGLLMLFGDLFNLGVFLLIVASIALIFAYLTKHYLILVLTNKRIIIRFGIVQLNTINLRLDKIESFEIENPPVGRILNYSRVVVSGTGSRTVIVPYVQDARAFKRDLDNLIDGED